jgi:hypothetical protein
MRTHKKIAIGMVATIVSIATLFLFPISFQKNKNNYEYEEKTSHEWKKYSSKTVGIEFEIPEYLEAFPLREISFRESEDGPGFVSVRTEYVGSKTVTEALEEIRTKNPESSEKIIDTKIINGVETIITVSNSADSDQQQKTAYFVRGNLLYTISSRWIDQERFWNSMKFID